MSKDLMIIATKKELEKFHRKYVIEKGSACWLWAEALVEGYGRFCGERTESGIPAIQWGAHRFSYLIHRGAIPDGMFVCHRCDVRRCVNPDHLFLGTQADNVADMISKCRQDYPRGEKNGHAKLSDEQVLFIRQSALSQSSLARQFGVDKSSISHIVTGKNWRHLVGGRES